MSEARLTALRLVGFKSFAERTVVEFGPGISAVIGPNGSGKSNLADALRWTLGEQGRMLRTRRSEDVIFAGSSSRRAIGMADVTLVIDNSDHLLPVDFGEVEIGRRLYRSGESEYLLNRQRIRLRDLTELLDAGNLADNAFLFIGQGMVDQALALRPEERRPLFEEAAGVRRHERRRRHAEAELVEAEANLERLCDVLAELRPQARRLSAQAEQLRARRTAGLELAEGLLAAARARWTGLSGDALRQQRDLDRARVAADRALRELKTAEEEAGALSHSIAERSEAERSARDELDRHRAELAELRVSGARLESELTSLLREAERLTAERAAIGQRLATAARVLGTAQAPASTELDDQLDLLDRQIAELEPTNAPSDLAGELRARQAELEQHGRRRAAVAESLAGAAARLAELDARLAEAEPALATAIAAAAQAHERRATTDQALVAARQAAETASAAVSAARDRLAATDADLAGQRARLAALDAALAGADDGLSRAARARGAELVGEGLEVDPDFRAAVSAALGAVASAYLVDETTAAALAGRRGTLALAQVTSRQPRSVLSVAEQQLVERAIAAGGGRLADSLRRDPRAEVTRLLRRVVWLPDLTAALALHASLPAGWRAVTIAGEVVSDEGVVGLSSGESVLERRVERDAVAAEEKTLQERATHERATLDRERASATAAGTQLQAATRDRDATIQEGRAGDEAERIAQRRAEQLTRERDWQRSQVERLELDVAAVEKLVAHQLADVERLTQALTATADEQELATQRAMQRTELRARREDIRRTRDERNAAARQVEDALRRADIGRSMDEARLADLEQQSALATRRLGDEEARRSELAAATGVTQRAVGGATTALDTLLAAGLDERTRMVSAERQATDARERLRSAESASRGAEMAAMEARLQLDQVREQLALELATIGADGLRVLRSAVGRTEPEADANDEQDDAVERLDDLLAEVVQRWADGNATDHPLGDPPSATKLGQLRRRFNDLGAGNPFAVEEHEELSTRLESLDSQREDMERAITSTRELIASLSAMINEQFRSTFAALEDAFERRFKELFGGGDAELSMTMPEDISTTGIDIHARPPGKKRQPLSMLSGGERALTAVSLLLAMLEVRPVPFCVLDEVDAALDEANVVRFSRALRGLSERTQFIVITHNRGTIEGADALYGVTLGDDAVSRVVSLRLPGEAAANLVEAGA